MGHSQGGMVGAHIQNYYWTGLDQVTGGRVVQTVGTPYQVIRDSEERRGRRGGEGRLASEISQVKSPKIRKMRYLR